MKPISKAPTRLSDKKCPTQWVRGHTELGTRITVGKSCASGPPKREKAGNTTRSH